jgi:PAS domain S-box-containing protein
MDMPFVGVAIFNARSRRWKRVNDRFCAIVGYDREELARLSWPEISHPDDRERAGKKLQHLAARRSRHKQFKQRLVRKNGSIVNVDVDATDWQSPRSGDLAIVALVTESRIHDTGGFLHAVVQQSITGIYVIENGVFTFANPHMAAMFGYSPGEIVGKAVQDLVAVPYRALVVENIRKRSDGEVKSIQYEFRGLRKDGTDFDVLVQGSIAEIEGRRAVVGVIQDISDRNKAHGALIESEQRYRKMYLANPQPMWVFDEETLRFLSVNDAAVAHYGWSQEEFLAMTIADVRPAGDEQRLLSQVDEQRRQEIVSAGVWKHRKKDGGTIDVEITAHSIDFGGRAARVVLAHDITARKHAQSALKASEERFRAMIENAPDLIITIDAQGMITYASPSLADVGGYAPDEVVGRNFMDFTFAEDAAAAAHTLVDVLQKPMDPLRAELRWRHKNGRAVVLETIAKNQLANPAIRAIVINARDVTSRKQVELAVHESEERFRAVLEQSIAAMYVLQDDQIVYVNPRMREIFGYAPDEAFDPDPLAHVKESDRPKVIDEIRRRLTSESKAAYTITALRKDRSEFTLGVHATRAVYRGQPAIIAVAQDITEKARAEDESRRYVERLEKAMQSTIEVVSRIGELRDPYTHGHERRVGELAAAIGAEMGLDASAIEGIRVAGYVHDVGKIGVPAELLAKPTRLTATEFELIKDHARQSHEILKGIEFPWPVAQIALQHHERLDGSGYPSGLKGDAIIPEARLLSVADVVEAMATHRPYRAAIGIDKALAEIERGRGKLYDPVVVDACLRLFREKSYQLPA